LSEYGSVHEAIDFSPIPDAFTQRQSL